MERESFEDEQVAKLLNDNFVSIKVDREERPDIDHLYMTACQAMTGQGGWPLTLVLTPDQRPFFAGTYFPKHSRYGLIGFVDLLEQIRDKWGADRERIEATGLRMEEMLHRVAQGRPGSGLERDPSIDLLTQAYQSFSESFDETYGGFGDAPKFPSPHQLLFLLRYARGAGRTVEHSDRSHAMAMVERTLDAMAQGGIYDHVGGGFARYSTDREWLVPHFEKMLYDNALLAWTYTEAYQVTGKSLYEKVARETLEYLLRDMQSPDGAFYAAEDADSEGEEGTFYLWTPEAVNDILGGELAARYCRFYNITTGGNFEGRNIPNRLGLGGTHPFADGEASVDELFAAFCRDEGVGVREWSCQLVDANRLLLEARSQRVRPARDDKVLTGWNALVIAAFSVAGRAFSEPRYVAVARRAADWLEATLRRSDGRLLARYCDGEVAIPAYLDDHVFLCMAYLELYAATWDFTYLERALRCQQEAINLFWDDVQGGFYLSGQDAEQLLARAKEWYDGALPSGNSVALVNMLRLARITGDMSWDELATQQLRAFAGHVAEYPSGYTYFLMGLQWAVWPTEEIVLAGRPNSAEMLKARSILQTAYLPFTVYMIRPDGPEEVADMNLERVSPFVVAQRAADGCLTVYVCERMVCRQPLRDGQVIREWLQTIGE